MQRGQDEEERKEEEEHEERWIEKEQGQKHEQRHRN